MKDIANYLLPPSATLREVIETIDSGGAQIAMVVDAQKKLLGVITDGDVRRAVLRGKSLHSLAKDVMCREFRALSSLASEDEALSVMRSETLHQIPAIDQRGRVIRLFLLETLIKPKLLTNVVVIMAGGEGKRLGHLTKTCPKPMLRVGGKPLLEIILEQCIVAGFHQFYLSVNYLKEQIQDYFGDGARWQVNISYLEESKPLGTGGALSLLPKRPLEPILILNGDVLSRVDYGSLLRFHSEHNAAATMCVREHSTQIPYGVVRMSDLNVLTLEEKPVLSHYVNAGIYLLNPSLLDFVPENCFFDMPQLLEKILLEKLRVSAFPIHEYWLDVGLPETLERAKGDWL